MPKETPREAAAEDQSSNSTALVTTFSVFNDRALFVVASWAPSPANKCFALNVDWASLGLTPGPGLKVSAPAAAGWQAEMALGDGTAAPVFGVPAGGGLTVVAS